MVTLVNRAYVSTATTGTGTLTLGAAEAGFQDFAAAGVANGDMVRYTIVDGTDWEIGTGIYSSSGPTLTRIPSESSNSGAAINLSGAAKVFVTAAAEDIKEPFAYNAVSGATQALDVGSFNFFDAGTLTEDTTISFANVPSEAGWTYTANAGVSPYSLTSAKYDGVNFSVTNEEFFPTDVFFKPDGTKMYVIGIGTNSAYQYTLSTAWDLSTASYDSVSFSIAAQDTAPAGFFFKPDGTQMYVVGANTDSVHQYTLSTAWDLSSASYDSVSFSVTNEEVFPSGVFFKPDGTKMYVIGTGTDNAYQYTLSTAWDLSTASYDSVSFSVAAQDTAPSGVFFKPDGTKMYVIGTGTDSAYQYTLSTAWDLSTASYDSVSYSVAAQDTAPQGFFFKPDGTKMFTVGDGDDRVNQYSTTRGFTITLPSSVESPLSISTETGELVVYTFFTSNSGSTVYLQATNRTGLLIDNHLDTSSAASGQVLLWGGEGYVWGSGGATSLNELSDAKANSFGGIGIGSGALAASSSPSASVAIGRDALSLLANFNSNNTAIGDRAGDSLVTGSGNVVVGASSDLVTGLSNTVTIGYQAVSRGLNAIAIGQGASANARTVAMGRGQFSSFGFAEDSVFIGDFAGKDKTGSYNIGIGWQAGQSTGNGTGTDGIAIGRQARSGVSGSDNISLGKSAGFDLTTGGDNVAIGREAGTNLTTGLDNVAIGRRAGDFTTTGSNQIVIGAGADASSATVSNEITLGNSSITTLRCQVTTITSLSDARDKTDIQPLNAGLEFVEALNPVSFNWNMRDGGKVGVADTGFIAQDLQAAQADTGVTIPDLVYDVNPDKLEAGYGKLIPVLVQAIKDLSDKVKDLESKLEAK